MQEKKLSSQLQGGKNTTPIPGTDSGDQQKPGCYKVYRGVYKYGNKTIV